MRWNQTRRPSRLKRSTRPYNYRPGVSPLEDRVLPGDGLLGVLLAHGLIPERDPFPTSGPAAERAAIGASSLSMPATQRALVVAPTPPSSTGREADWVSERAHKSPSPEAPGVADPVASQPPRTTGDELVADATLDGDFAADPHPSAVARSRVSQPADETPPPGDAVTGPPSGTTAPSGGFAATAPTAEASPGLSFKDGLESRFTLTTPLPPAARGASSISVTDLSPANGATGLCTDTPLTLTFDQEPHISTSGVIGVHRADGSLADRIDLGEPASFRRFIGGAQSGGVPYAFNYYPVIVTGNAATIYLHQALDYNQTYFVTIDPGVFTDAAGNAFPGISDPDAWSFSTKPAGPADGATRLTVAADNSGDFCTVQSAIDFVPVNNTRRVVISIRPGTYTEIVYVRSSKPLITVDGEDRDRTVVQYANNNNFNGAVSGNFRTMFGVDAPDFTLSNITLHNLTPHGGSQAEAFRGGNQRILLNHVNLMSFQDTLLLQGKGFVNDSYIEGDVDFMWGNGTVFFQNSELKAVTSNGYYTQIRNPQGTNGDVFVNCRLTRADDNITGSYLARIDPTVFPYSQVVYINTAMGPHIRPVGWLLNNATEAPNVQFWEYHSTDLDGAPLDVSQRAPFSRQLTDAEAAQWGDPAFVLDGWVPDLTPPAFHSLTASPHVLRPPNHRLVPVTLRADVSDDGDPAPATRIVSVTSNGPDRGEPDWEITGDLTLNLRAERNPHGAARVYTITVESRDFSGNRSFATTDVIVPRGR